MYLPAYQRNSGSLISNSTELESTQPRLELTQKFYWYGGNSWSSGRNSFHFHFLSSIHTKPNGNLYSTIFVEYIHLWNQENQVFIFSITKHQNLSLLLFQNILVQKKKKNPKNWNRKTQYLQLTKNIKTSSWRLKIEAFFHASIQGILYGESFIDDLQQVNITWEGMILSILFSSSKTH